MTLGCKSDKQPKGEEASAALTMVAERDIPFVWSDAWLLLTIVLAGRERAASLQDVVGTGDAINHAIFTFDEIDGGTARLQQAGLIMVSEQHFRPTDTAVALFDGVSEEGLYETMDAAPQLTRLLYAYRSCCP